MDVTLPNPKPHQLGRNVERTAKRILNELRVLGIEYEARKQHHENNAFIQRIMDETGERDPRYMNDVPDPAEVRDAIASIVQTVTALKKEVAK